MTIQEYNDEYFRIFFNCVTSKEVVEEVQKKIYLNAFKQAIVSLVARKDLSDLELNRQVALAVSRAYTAELITADEAQSLIRYKRLAINYLRKGVNV